MRAFAHRGGAQHPDLLGLENTLRAFRHAADLGYTDLETDVHVTRDGVLVAFHDDVLDRVTDAVGSVADATWAQVRGARIDGREPVPTFGELLDELPACTFNADLKSDAAAYALSDLLDARGAHDRVLVGSFSARRLRLFRRLTHGRVATGAHPGEVAAFRLLPSAALVALVTGDRADALQVPVRVGPLRLLTAGFVRRAHALGVPVHVWTVDDPARMRALLDAGVDGLMTDRTDVLREVLRERGVWSRENAANPR